MLEALNLGSRIKNLLITCAAALFEEKMEVAKLIMQDLCKLASVFGNPLEKLAAYMSEGLVARLYAFGSAIYKALKCREASAIEVLLAMQQLYEICPYSRWPSSKVSFFRSNSFRACQWALSSLQSNSSSLPSKWEIPSVQGKVVPFRPKEMTEFPSVQGKAVPFRLTSLQRHGRGKGSKNLILKCSVLQETDCKAAIT